MIPQDMKDVQLITLFKNKGSSQDCNSYQVISLLSLFGKLLGDSSWTDSKYWQTECILNISVVSERTDHCLTGYLHWDFSKKNI